MPHTFLSMSTTSPGKKDEHELAEQVNDAKKFNQGHGATDRVAVDPKKLENLPPMRKPEQKERNEDSSSHKPK